MSLQPYNRFVGTAYRAGLSYNPYARAANTAAFVYNNRRKFYGVAKTAANTARLMRNAVRNRKRQKIINQKRSNFSPQNIGMSPGIQDNKIARTDETDPVNQDTRTLYSSIVTDIPQGTEENQRLRRVVHLKGLKVCFEGINIDTEAHYLNVCLLSPKGNASGVEIQDFFRFSSSSRATDFSNVLNGMEFACLPLNTDRYTVLHRTKKLLVAGTQSGLTNDLTGSNHTLIEFYAKINRQLRYDSASATESGAIYLVYWIDRVGAVAGSAPALAKIQVARKVVCYFSEPSCCT